LLPLSTADILAAEMNPLASVISDPLFSTCMNIRFDRGRLLALRIEVRPDVNVSNRGGYYVGAVIPVERPTGPFGALSDLKISDARELTFYRGAVRKTLMESMTIRWAPGQSNYTLRTPFPFEIVKTSIGPTTNEQYVNGNCLCVFALAYESVAVDAPSIVEEKPSHLTFHVSISAHIELDTPVSGDGNKIARATICSAYAQPVTAVVGVESAGRRADVPISEFVRARDGGMYLSPDSFNRFCFSSSRSDSWDILSPMQ